MSLNVQLFTSICYDAVQQIGCK